MNKELEFNIELLGTASVETKGLPNGSTEQVGLIKQNGISDED